MASRFCVSCARKINDRMALPVQHAHCWLCRRNREAREKYNARKRMACTRAIRREAQQPYQESPAVIEATYQRALAQIKAERRFTVDVSRRSPLADVR